MANTRSRSSKARRVRARRHPTDRERFVGYALSISAILFGLWAMILPLPMGLAGILCATIALSMLRHVTLPRIGLAVALLGTVGGFLLGWILRQGA
jgi:hypothetical protein